MRVEVKNEYDMLKSVILGRPEGANWPTGDHYFDKMISCSTYEEPLQRGKIDDTIVQIARMNMLYMKDKLEDIGIGRPSTFKSHSPGLMHNTSTPESSSLYLFPSATAIRFLQH